jgi:alpha-L-fucosidase
VIDAYQPDFIWHDVGIVAIPEKYRLNHLAYYYNRAAERGREVMVSFKNEELNRDCAVLDFEGGATDDIASFSWVCDQNLGPGSWGYVEGMKYYPAKTVLHSLITIVIKNGSLLLNLSPRADGTIPQEQKEIALSLGRWLGKFGECISGTRPWATYGEGPAHAAEGIQECTAQDIRFTRNKAGTALYAIVCVWPGDGAQINVPGRWCGHKVSLKVKALRRLPCHRISTSHPTARAIGFRQSIRRLGPPASENASHSLSLGDFFHRENEESHGIAPVAVLGHQIVVPCQKFHVNGTCDMREHSLSVHRIRLNQRTTTKGNFSLSS